LGEPPVLSLLNLPDYEGSLKEQLVTPLPYLPAHSSSWQAQSGPQPAPASS
jgi:hypothetical protein